MDFKELKYFIAIAEEQNITKAAAKLYVSQSTLSLFLIKMENDLGVQLFRRVKNHLEITSKGELCLKTAKEILRIHEQLIEKLHEPDILTLKIGISSQLMIRVVSDTFMREKNEGIPLNIIITEGRTVNILDKLSNGEVDLAIVASDTLLKDSRFNVEMVNMEDFVFVYSDVGAPKSDQADYQNPPQIDPQVLNNKNLVLTPFDTCDYRIAKNIITDYQIEPKNIIQVNDTTSRLRMVANNADYIGIMPLIGVPRNLNLQIRRPIKPHYRYMMIAHPTDYEISPEERAFLNASIHNYIHSYPRIQL